MEDQVPEDVAHERFDRLLAVVKRTGEAASSRFQGETHDVLVEELNKEPGYVTGRISQNIVVHVPGTKEDIGRIIPVVLDDCRGFYYFGTRADLH
jgi:tRNA-2-methylthio-N6-dimethylallyladenosine synthase